MSSIVEKETEYDVTLCCTESFISTKPIYIPAHSVMLSSASLVLRDMFQSINRQSPSPTIMLIGIQERDMKYILDYIYKGEVEPSPEHLTSFICAANELKIIGICDEAPEQMQWASNGQQWNAASYNCVFTDPTTGGLSTNTRLNNGTAVSTNIESKIGKKKETKHIVKPIKSQNVISKKNKPNEKTTIKTEKTSQSNNRDEENVQIQKTETGGGLCLVCNKEFSQYKNVKPHYIKTHGEEIPGAGRYVCIICQMNPDLESKSRFNFQANFKEHCKSEHKVNGELKRIAEEGDGAWMARDEKDGGYCLKCNSYYNQFKNLKPHFMKAHHIT